MGSIFRRLGYWLTTRSREDELAEEIECHRAMAQADLERSGKSSEQAAVESRRTLGNIRLAREDARAVWIWPTIDHLRRDVRYALRGLRRQPVFAAAAILTLAVGIAAVTTVFSVVHAELWKPLPFRGVDRLVTIYTTGSDASPSYDPVSGPDFLDWQARQQTLEALAGFGNASRRVLRGRAAPEFVRVKAVTSNFFETLQLRASIGRALDPGDGATTRAAVLADAAWRRFFNGRPDIVGQALVIDEQTYTVAGVMPAGERLIFTDDPDVFIATDFTSPTLRDRTRRSLNTVARLQPGVTVDAAAADLKRIASQLAQEHPASHAGRSVTIWDLSTSSAGYNWRPLYFFLGAAVFVLVLSAVNVASLLLARALGRQREFAIRSALGGGTSSLVRQLVVEGAVIAVPGTAAGVLLAVWAAGVVSSAVPPDYLVRGSQIAIDGRVLSVAAGLGGLTTMLFGLAPALFSRIHVVTALASGGRSASAPPRERRARHALVVAQITTAFVLVFGAGLFLNSFVRLTQVPLGFDPANRFTLGVSLTGSAYAAPQDVLDFSRDLLARVEAIPGVARAAVTTSVPLGSGPLALFGVGGAPTPAPGEEQRSIARGVSPGYFDTVGIRRLAGRDFTDQDVAGSTPVVIINEAIARRIFKDGHPVGQSIALLPGSRTPWLTPATLAIVGVVGNVKDVGINEVEFYNLYLPFAQRAVSPLQIVVQSAIPADQLTDRARRTVLDVDPRLPLPGVMTMAARVDQAFRGERFHLLLIGAFALTALVLAAISIYAAMAYASEQRTPEFGLRLALGARPSAILGLALEQAVRLGVLGTALGLAVALIVARALGDALYLVPRSHNGLIYGVTTTDPLTLAAASIVLLTVAVAAGLLPARRAAAVDPATALR